MPNIPSLHPKKDFNSLINSYYIAIVPLIIFSFYKNGLSLYFNGLINLTGLIPLFYFYGSSLIVALLISLIFKEKAKVNILLSLIITSTISLNTNYLIYPILLFVLFFITKYLTKNTKLTFNSSTLIRLFLILGLLLNSYSYLNIGEKLAKFKYSYFDIFCGFNAGGLASTSTFILLFSLLILLFNKYYKKTVALSSIISYVVFLLLAFFLTQNLSYLTILFSGHAYFSFIFLASDLYVTPYSKKGMLIYGILIGILTGLLSLINVYEAPFISIFLLSLFIPLLNKITNQTHLK